MLVDVAVAVGNPFLPPGTYSRKLVILAASPDGVRILQPKWRGVRSRGQIDINVWLGGAQILNQIDSRVEIAIELAARSHSIGVARTVNFELVDSVLLNHLQADVVKMPVVFRA